MQYEHALLQPSMTDKNAVHADDVGCGILSNFSISGNDTSTTRALPERTCATSSGNRCSVCGPNTMSTNGARFKISAPSWLATQPPTPMMRFGFSSFSARQRPSSENTFSCAFSRTEHVFTSTISACAASGVACALNATVSTSAILAESYSFIWQPYVWMKKRSAI